MQGLGLYTLEELKFSPSGLLYTRGPSQYKIPAVCDVPLRFNVYLLPDSHNPHAIYSSKVRPWSEVLIQEHQHVLSRVGSYRIHFNPPTPLGSPVLQGIGEPTVFLGSSVFFAIKDAVAAARSESGLVGPFTLDSPAIPERVCLACVSPFTQMVKSGYTSYFLSYINI